MNPAEVEPNACRYCDAPQRMHCQRYVDAVGWHGWVEPTDGQRLTRMRARRAARHPVPREAAPCRVCNADSDGPLCRSCLDRPYGTVGTPVVLEPDDCPTCYEPHYVWYGNLWSLRHVGGNESIWNCPCLCHTLQIWLAEQGVNP